MTDDARLKKGRTAVLVNDDATQLTLFAGLLRKNGIKALTFENAEAALSAMAPADPPDIIVTDLYMPGVDGWRFCRLLRSPEYKAFNQVPILVVSATFSGDEAARITADLGANAFIPLPVDGGEFVHQTIALMNRETPKKQLRVLIADDSRSMLNLLKETFEVRGYRADAVLSRAEAASALEAAHYDAAVIDYHLGEKKGDDLVAAFKTRQPDCVWIMITVDPRPELALECMKKGASDYLRKPFDPEYLIEVCARSRREKSLLRVEQLLDRRTRELKENEEWLRRVFDTSMDAIIIFDQNGKILSANPAARRMYGYAEGEMEGLSGRDIVHPDHHHLFGKFKTLAERGGDFQAESMDVRKDGTPFHADVRGGVFQHKGKPHLLAVVRDITNRKNAEEERARLETQVQQAQRLESVGRLAGGVAHDLNNLLAPILGYAEMLLDDFDPGDARRASADEIVRAGLRARDLVRQLLAFSRKQMLEFKPANLNTVLERFEKLLRRAIREDVAMELDLFPDLPPVRGDVGQLEQVIMNLAVNAQDAMPGGGSLVIRTSASESEDGTGAGCVSLAMEDTGVGMDEETRRRIFEPFFTTKDVNQGTGLGLATVYGIVKQHGGDIRAESAPGKGARFIIRLPASEEFAPPIETAEAEIDNPRGFETILLAEDNKQVKHLAHAILTRQGYTVLTAADGKDALRLMQNYDGPLHLLLTDVVMPEISGRDLFVQMSERFPDMKALYMSGYADDVIVHHGVLDKGVNFIHKPFSPRGLAVKVRSVLDQP